jgi:catechol 2,3-dioxygenase-like lactoylglutathione lyase family enzyme
MALIKAGSLHRLAVAIDDLAPAHEWFESVLGASVLKGLKNREISGSGGSPDLEGTESSLLRVGGYPFILLSKGDPGGPVASFLARYGPGVHSLAWEVDDMWAVQNLLIERGIRISSVSVPGRHFFMHPRDTDGVLMEWTDDSFGPNGRQPEGEGDGIIDVTALAWVTAVVVDAEATAAFLTDLADATPISGNAQGSNEDELTIDLGVGDMTIRLVTPKSAKSRYAAVEMAPRLCSFAFRVNDLDASLKALEGVGVPTVDRQDELATTDPAATFGLSIEWTT